MSRFLTAHWRNLVIANYEVDPAVLKLYVPATTVLDNFAGVTYVSIVAFQFLRTKVLGMPIPFHRNFEEINLRFYVKREVAGETRRGVVFIREIVPRRAIAWIARAVYQEPYIALPTRSEIVVPTESLPGHFSYEWQLKEHWYGLSATALGKPQVAAAGSVEEFISEHYWGYSKQKNGTTIEYRVEHPQWRVWKTLESMFSCDVEKLYGKTFTKYLEAAPSSVFLADGSPITVYRGSLV